MHQRLKAIREEMKFSYAEMADMVGLKRATYQGYETGRRATPPHVIAEAEAALQRHKDWPKRYDLDGEYTLGLDREYPHGIMSDVRPEA